MKFDVHAQLQDDIVGGIFAPGDALVEQSLAERYGVSRTPVRETLKRLQAAGLVEQFARGYRVTRHTPEDILDIYEVRIALEQSAAKAAARRCTPFDIARIHRAHERMVEMVARTPSEASQGTHAFHQMIWAAAHNATLVSTLTALQRRIAAFSATTLSFPGRGIEAGAEHAQILAAIVQGDAELAGSLAALHMTKSRDIRVQIYSDPLTQA